MASNLSALSLFSNIFLHSPYALPAFEGKHSSHAHQLCKKTAPRAHTRKVHSKVPCFECTLKDETESCSSVVMAEFCFVVEFCCCGWIPAGLHWFICCQPYRAGTRRYLWRLRQPIPVSRKKVPKNTIAAVAFDPANGILLVKRKARFPP